ncbi:hypothetical protein [Sphingomonas abietis]|uniref:Nucleotidyltransferase n=1 Tax=Sphingomonas abietis TaxID=3012344 RepID=A0ABY7NS74_9SPHN|nr:hypothetical protein [Sphingomonas abietis]WBO24355.1 hypothetical protein PBT88_09755 [Sphingomonas abietis]
MIEPQILYDEIYSSGLVMARVGHLDRSKREDIERITRIIREGFDGAGVLHPKPRITRIMLVGPYARRLWSGEGEAIAVPAYDFWIIISDRLLTHKRLWQATEVRIARELGGRCTVSLSLNSDAGFKAGKRKGDEYVCGRLNCSITLYHAKRDDPLTGRGTGKAVWTEALMRFDAAEAAFLPASMAFRDAERAYYAIRAERGSGLSNEDDEALHRSTGLDIAIIDEQRLGAARHEAVMELLHTPAPDLAAIIRKLELVRDEGDGDDHVIVSILADVRWIARRIARCGRPS